MSNDADRPRSRFIHNLFALGRGDAVDYRFVASALVAFNIHYHQGKTVVTPVQKDSAREAAGKLVADAGQTYCMMWTAAWEGAATVRYRFGIERL